MERQTIHSSSPQVACPPNTVTVRRNPRRKVRAPSPDADAPASAIRSFPIEDILSIQLPQNPGSSDPEPPASPESRLKVFLRVRPQIAPRASAAADLQPRASRAKNAWPQTAAAKAAAAKKKKQKKAEVCLAVKDDHSVTLAAPQALQELKRTKSEVFGGYSQVFSADSSQGEVYEKMMSPLVEDFLRGRSGMLAAMGPSGSGKTHTVFGTPREPGMVPLALRQIFEQTKEKDSQTSRSFFISMFEISSEGGKSERLLDLSPEGADLCARQPTIKGLREVVVSDLAQAESIIACGMLKRATATTSLNSQSSRSQCVINICYACNNIAGEVGQSDRVVLTIVDLAGSEKEKRTRHQGVRLVESNFINNTSMVFGSCLRSLLEHQKNPKRPLQKHSQNSLLTRHLRDYLEGKKRMALILTVRSEEDDYLDTSFLLRQASPYMEIKFNHVEGPSNLVPKKRRVSVFPRIEQHKRAKFSEDDASVVEGCTNAGEDESRDEGLNSEQLTESKASEFLVQHQKFNRVEVNDGTSQEEDCINCNKKERSSQIMQGFSKALWSVLKQYKEKLKVVENEARSLKESLKIEKEKNFDLEKKLRDVKSNCLCHKDVFAETFSVKLNNDSESQFYGSRFLRHGSAASATVHEPNAELRGLTSGQTSVDMHSPNLEASGYKNASRICNGVQSSIMVSQINAEQEDLKSRYLSIGEPALEKSFIEVDTNSECEGVSTHECPNDAEESKLLVMEDSSNANETEAASLTSKSTVSSVTHDQIGEHTCLSGVQKQSNSEEDKGIYVRPSLPKETKQVQDAGYNQEYNGTSAHESDVKIESCSKPLDAGKPKRRLLPASSVLVRGINGLCLDDENDPPKGKRGQKNVAADGKHRTQGSMNLLRLLKNVPR